MNQIITKNKTLLFLGYSKEQTKIIEKLSLKKFNVIQQSEKIDKVHKNIDLVVSFGYKHILSTQLIAESKAPIINIHLSLLPWNRGAHPNFWSFWDNTPSGVTIHKIDPGIDTGPIIYQKAFEFNSKSETFRSTYNKLFSAAEDLILDKIEKIIKLEFDCEKQRGKSTFHFKKDLPTDFSGWDSNVYDEIQRLENNGFNPSKRLLDVIDEIENARTVNNVNWMSLLRIVAIEAPDKLAEITSKINKSDEKITSLFRKLFNS